MKRAFEITLNVTPTAKGRPFVGKRGAFTPVKTRNAEAEIRWLLQNANAPLLQGAIHMVVKAFFKRPKSAPAGRVYPAVRPDLDNVVKLVKDACNNILFDDDAQICAVTAIKVYGHPQRVELQVIEMD